MNSFTFGHLKKCYKIAEMFAECYDIDTHKFDDNFLIIIAYFFYERYEPVQYISLYFKLLSLNKLQRIEIFNELLYEDYYFDKFMFIKGDL